MEGDPAAADHGSLTTSPTDGASKQPVVPSTKTASAWAGLAGGMLLVVAVLVFILQNLTSVRVSFVTLHWRIPLGVDLLFSVVLGGLIVFAAGSLRILQLRRLAHRHARRHDTHH